MKVDIRAVVHSKNIKLYNKIPSFVFSLFERIIYQREINELLELYSHLRGVEFITAILDHLNIRRKVVYLSSDSENSSNDRPLIFASNHPLGGVDGFVILEHLAEKYGDVKIVVNDILMNIEPVKELFVPVNKHGRQSSDSARQLSEILASNTPLVYFPAGLCSRKIGGKITDLPWQRNFVKKALESGRDIVPMRVDSFNSHFFYNFALLRGRLKIKSNLEMILLPSEIFKKRGKEIKVIIGDKIEHSTLKQHTDIKQFVENIRERCYSL